MAGTKEGGLKASETNKRKYGENWYGEIGRKGGKVCSPFKGFGSNHKRASEAGRKGGKISKRRKHHMMIKLSEEQINLLIQFCKTKSVTTAVDFTRSIASMLDYTEDFMRLFFASGYGETLKKLEENDD